MRAVKIFISDEFYDALESMLGKDLALDGMNFAIDTVDRSTEGEMRCQGIFQAWQLHEGGPRITRTIEVQDRAFEERSAKGESSHGD